MKRLKKRVRSDTHISEARRPRPRTWDRNVYLALLVLFFAGLGNYVAGDRLFLRADGLVMLDRTVIGATALVQVTEVGVRPGQRVEEGQMLVKAESLETLGRLAELSMREAEVAERRARLRSELAMARELQPRAAERVQTLLDRHARLAALETSRLVTLQRREVVADTHYDADVRSAVLTAQIDGLAAEIAALDATHEQAKDAVRNLKTRYRDGVHTAGRAGTIGDRVPAAGEVLNPGEPLLTLYWGEPYVLAYLPQNYLFDLTAGEAVTVNTGKLSRSGRIEAILPMSTAIPSEFRNAFRLRETRQLARISLDPGPELPTMAAVRITQGWTVMQAADEIARRLASMATATADKASALWADVRAGA